VAQVVPIGGEVREIQVEVEPSTLAARQLPLAQLVDALGEASASPAAGFHVDSGQEHLVRGATRARTPADFGAAVVRSGEDGPLTVADVARVTEGNEPKRGTAAYKARPAVILSVQKQPGANTLALTRALDARLAELERSFPPGIRLERENFRQADFIQVAIRNVSKALVEGAVLVVLVLVLFLGDGRSTLISALALPTSLIAGVLAFSAFGAAIDTMTLGGLTIAIGALVDDAIIDVENVLRRLRENRRRPESERRPALETIFLASSEVRGAILFATLVIAIVFAPLFFLPGIEGLLLRPLGLAYLAALVASMFVSLTLTPALCLLLLPRSRAIEKGEPRLLRFLQRRYTRSLDGALRRPWPILALSVLLLDRARSRSSRGSGGASFRRSTKGSLTVGVVAPPGTSLADSDALGQAVEETLLAFPEVVSTSRRTGRAERDEHVQGANASEMEVVLRPGRPKPELLAEMRRTVTMIPGVVVSFGQPISHRIDHMLSGSKSNLAIKLFGPELATLRTLARQVEEALKSVPDLVDVSNQEQALVPQLAFTPDRAALARLGLTAFDAAQNLEALFQGTLAAELVEDGLSSRVVVRYPERLREDRERLAELPLATPQGAVVPLGAVARTSFDLGPGLVRRGERRAGRFTLRQCRRLGSDRYGRAGTPGDRRPDQAARRVPDRVRRAVRGSKPERSPDGLAFAWRPARDLGDPLACLSSSPAGCDRARELAAGPGRRNSRPRVHLCNAQHRVDGRLRDAVRHRHAQRRPLGFPLPALNRGGRPALGGCPSRLARAARSGADDRADRRPRPDSAGPGRGPTRQRDPEPDGRRDPGRSADLDVSQRSRRAGALPALRRLFRVLASRRPQPSRGSLAPLRSARSREPIGVGAE
jgi:Cu/Ag efflux pump CusA